jgi:hypothetical protein
MFAPRYQVKINEKVIIILILDLIGSLKGIERIGN